MNNQWYFGTMKKKMEKKSPLELFEKKKKQTKVR